MSEEAKATPNNPVESMGLLGSGVDLSGRFVRYCGHLWRVRKKLVEYGSWEIVRRELRGDELVTIGTTIDEKQLPSDHQEFAELLPPND